MCVWMNVQEKIFKKNLQEEKRRTLIPYLKGFLHYYLRPVSKSSNTCYKRLNSKAKMILKIAYTKCYGRKKKKLLDVKIRDYRTVIPRAEITKSGLTKHSLKEHHNIDWSICTKDGSGKPLTSLPTRISWESPVYQFSHTEWGRREQKK